MSKKNNNDILKKALNSSNNTYEDKLAILKFITKKKYKYCIFSIFCNIKKEIIFSFFNYKKTIPIVPFTILPLNICT